MTVEDKNPKSIIDESQNLTDEQKAEINRRILQSGGILRDYDTGEVLHPMNLAVLNVLNHLYKEAKDAL